MTEKHQMVRNGQSEFAGEEWSCPQCGRRILLRWPPPRLEQLVLEAGDATAVHVGATSGISVGGVTAVPVTAGADRQWLREHGIDWDGPTPA